MSREMLTNRLEKIAGSNVIMSNDKEKAALCKCVNYLATQLQILANDLEESPANVFKLASEILEE